MTRPTRRPARKIVGSAREIFERADMVVKVKEPQPAEWAQLRDGQLL